ncbi:hypothetical protein BGX34_004472 [Mortierella sp. NVP85]|nr:hypothetical protein BGX34_004472 [Mortierella sp. NVP85]
MSNNASIFNIPHIMESVGSYLDCEDRASCRLVNRSFDEHFKRLIWRNLVFQGSFHFEASKADAEYLEALRDNSYLTRSVLIRANYHGSVLSVIASSHMLLRHLNSHIGFTGVDNNEVFVTRVLKIVDNNPDLLTWSMISEVTLTVDALIQVPSLLKTRHCLEVLSLTLNQSPCLAWLKYFLKSLPLSLKKLALTYWGPKLDDEEFQFVDPDWPNTYPNMEVAAISTELEEEKEETIVQFLMRCPELKSLTYPPIANVRISNPIAELGSRLHNLAELNLSWTGGIQETQWLDLVTSMKGRIRSFTTDSRFSRSSPNLIRLMVDHWHDTLESLRFNWFSSVYASDLDLILATCSKLKVLDCMWTTNYEDFQDIDLEGQDWVCSDLEVLRFMSVDHRAIHPGESEQLIQESRTLRRVEHTYQQLGRLVKLKDLTLGWGTLDPSPTCANLDMSLKGLEQMGGLKELEVLDISHLPRVSIGLPEAQWIAKSWPMLRMINGLRQRHRVQKKGAPYPDYILWLDSNRPDLTVQ